MLTATKETLGETIRRIREEHQLSSKDLAAQLSLSPSTLSKIEANQRTLSRQGLAKLAALFDIDEQELRVKQLADKMAYELFGESDISDRVLQVAEEKLKYLRQKNTIQGNIEF